jgi:hypothetical protein
MAACTVSVAGGCAVSSVADPGWSQNYVFSVRATAAGEFALRGIEYVSVGSVRLLSAWRRPFTFVCDAEAPALELSCVCEKHEILAGDAAVLELCARAGPLGIASLSMIVDGDDHIVSLIGPRASQIGGQYFLGPLAAGSAVRVSLLVSSPVPGTFTNWIFFGYGQKGGLPRYQHFCSRIRVYECVNALPSFPSFYPWPMPLKISIKHLDDHEFKVIVQNQGKRPVREVTVELAAADQGQGFIVSGLTRRVFQCLDGRAIVAFCFYFLSLDFESYPIMKVTIGSTSHVADLTVLLHHYDV